MPRRKLPTGGVSGFLEGFILIMKVINVIIKILLFPITLISGSGRRRRR
jgi:hypothetical protein